jgi:hypothetical protein
MVSVTTTVDSAGQLVTVGAQEVIVRTVVAKTVEVVISVVGMARTSLLTPLVTLAYGALVRLGSTAEVTPSPVLRGTEVGVTGTSTGPTELRTLEVVTGSSTGPTELRTLELVVLTKIGRSTLVEVGSTLVLGGAVVRGAAVEVSELVVELP